VEREPYFDRSGDTVVGRSHGTSAWGDAMLGGRQLAGLVAWGAERDHGHDDFQPARLTVDMFRPVTLVPLVVESELVREGSRIRVCDVTIRSEATVVCRGTVVFLRRGADTPGTVWSPPEWDAPLPDAVPPLEQARRWSGELRPITRWLGSEQRRVWFREQSLLVDGESLTPFLRVATVADFANPLGNGSELGLGYINADLTLYVGRLPVGEWIGCETVAHVHDEGIAIGGIALHDEQGRFGYSTCCALADPRMQALMPTTDPAATEA
jgi:hypothetical protein